MSVLNNYNDVYNTLIKSFTQSQIKDGVKVGVYFNLHKNCFSVISREKYNYGKILFHSNYIDLKDVNFKVRQAGRSKVIKEQRKNVHAFCYGKIFTGNNIMVNKAVSYNPYKAPHFFSVNDNKQIDKSDYLMMRVINNKGKLWTALKSNGSNYENK
jgi:hypothetical protein